MHGRRDGVCDGGVVHSNGPYAAPGAELEVERADPSVERREFGRSPQSGAFLAKGICFSSRVTQRKNKGARAELYDEQSNAGDFEKCKGDKGLKS